MPIKANMDMEPQICVDFDSTLFRLFLAMSRVEGFEDVDYDGCTNWDDLPVACGGIERMLACFDEAMKFENMNALGRDALYPGAVTALRRLRADGVKIHIVTDRPGERMIDTERFLRHRRVPFDTINKVRAADKSEWCIEHGVHVIVDDHPLTLAEAASYDLTGFTLEQPYSARIARRLGFGVFDSWREMGPAIETALDMRYAGEVA